MTRISGSAELMEKVCEALGCGAFGVGEITLRPKGGSEHMRFYDGGIIRIKAVLSAKGSCGAEELISRIDRASQRAEGFSGGGIIKISSSSPTVMAEADEKGFMRMEKDMDIIYWGSVG